MSVPQRGVLLVGPTGSGKTPVGELLQQRGLWGHACAHFDFGENLRACAYGGDAEAAAEAALSDDECAFLVEVLERGALLEDEHFPIARKILTAFLARAGLADDGYVVLNGLPRHAGQARDVAPIVRVEAVLQLACDEAVVLERIRGDVGGDRGGRGDDHEELVRRKVRTYLERTRPLVEHYRAAGARVVPVCVGAATTPEDAYAEIARRHP